MDLMSLELTEKQFKRISRIVHRLCGIYLKSGKEALVRARLMKRLRALRMSSFEAYIRYIESDAGARELEMMVDVMTTNKTSFFRESAHFDFLRDQVLPNLTNWRMRFWTAACSSGEEPYSLGILLREHVPDVDRKDVKILATDISTRMLERARTGEYGADTLRDLPRPLLSKYFQRVPSGTGGEPWYQVSDAVRRSVRFARLNLIEPWPMRGPFDVVFCRNVMIYFDRPTQQQLINRFWELLDEGGYLFVGHSEGLSAITHKFHYVRPAVYRK